MGSGQMVRHFTLNEEIIGSSPIFPAKYGELAESGLRR